MLYFVGVYKQSVHKFMCNFLPRHFCTWNVINLSFFNKYFCTKLESSCKHLHQKHCNNRVSKASTYLHTYNRHCKWNVQNQINWIRIKSNWIRMWEWNESLNEWIFKAAQEFSPFHLLDQLFVLIFCRTTMPCKSPTFVPPFSL